MAHDELAALEQLVVLERLDQDVDGRTDLVARRDQPHQVRFWGLADDLHQHVELLRRDADPLYPAARDERRGVRDERRQLLPYGGGLLRVDRARVDELVLDEVDLAALEPAVLLLQVRQVPGLSLDLRA